MDIKGILSKCDHTLLAQTSTWEQIKNICDEGIKYQTASVCIPPCFVKKASEYVQGKLKICTVIGFPNGYNTTKVKVYETEQAVLEGADEIDMVINIGALKEGNLSYVEDEIVAIKKACHGKLLKVIIETCLLTDEEIVTMCHIVTNSGAEYIKTSTGFSTEGATTKAVDLMCKNVGKGVLVKAAGGIKSLEDAQNFIDLGASRLGTSRVVKEVKKLEQN